MSFFGRILNCQGTGSSGDVIFWKNVKFQGTGASGDVIFQKKVEWSGKKAEVLAAAGVTRSLGME